MKSKWWNYGVWVSLTAAVLLGFQAVGTVFELQLASEKYNEVQRRQYGPGDCK